MQRLWGIRPDSPSSTRISYNTEPITTAQGLKISRPNPSQEHHPTLPIERSNSTASQGSKVVDYNDISPQFGNRDRFLKSSLRQQGNGNQTPDYLRGNPENRSHRRSEALASSPPMSPMVEEPRPSRFREEFDQSLSPGVGATRSSSVSSFDHPNIDISLHNRGFSDVSLGHEQNGHEDGARDFDHKTSRTFVPPPPIPPPLPPAPPVDQHPFYTPSSPRHSPPRCPPSTHSQGFLSKLRAKKRYILIAILALIVVATFIFFVLKLLPIYNKLQDLKERLAALDAFKDKVAAKLGGWLDDGKDLVENVKDKAKEAADKVVDGANKVLGKVKVSIPKVEMDRRGADLSVTALSVTAPPPSSPHPTIPTDTADATTLSFALEEKKAGSKDNSKSKPSSKSSYTCGIDQNCTSPAPPIHSIPLPILLLASLAKLAHGAPLPPSSSCTTSTLTATATVWVSPPTLSPRNNSCAHCLAKSTRDDVVACINPIPNPWARRECWHPPASEQRRGEGVGWLR